jgi:hypothetical protein
MLAGMMKKTKICLLVLSLAAGSASAQDAELLRCSEMSADKEARLACYDALAARTFAARQAGATPAAKAAVFGAESQPRRDELEAIDSHIEGLFEGWQANSVLRLANGQVWQVIDGSSAVVYLKNPKVRVRRAAMGSFILELEGSNETARVRRRDAAP